MKLRILFSVIFCFLLVGRLTACDTLRFEEAKFSKQQGMFSRSYSSHLFFGGDYESKTSRFSLIIHLKPDNPDEIVNLIITSIDNDSIFVGNNISCGPVSRVKTFQSGDDQFEILSISAKRKEIVFKKTKNIVPDILLFENKIPEIDFMLASGERSNFKKLIGHQKYVYVDFWGLWCPQCLKEVPKLKAVYDNYKGSLEIIALNSGDTPEEIQNYVTTNGISWLNGISSELIQRWFFLEAFPHGVLFDQNGRLIQMNCSVDDLNDYMSSFHVE